MTTRISPTLSDGVFGYVVHTILRRWELLREFQTSRSVVVPVTSLPLSSLYSARHCPGYALATFELYVGISKLLWEFEFSSATTVDLRHYTNSIPVRVKGFAPTVTRRVKGVKAVLS